MLLLTLDHYVIEYFDEHGESGDLSGVLAASSILVAGASRRREEVWVLRRVSPFGMYDGWSQYTDTSEPVFGMGQ